MTTSTPAAAVPPSPWILGPRRDLALFVATPVLILPLIFGLQGLVASAAIFAFVTAFGAMGHHLPGMMRAYGDRALFRRFRTRFILAPIVLAALCIAFAVRGSQGMILVAYLWGVWHGWMQTYGFMRIYDARVGSVARTTARWDFATCAAWFVGGVVFADTRVHYVQKMTVSLGLEPLSADAIGLARSVWIAVLAVVTVGFVVNAVRRRAAGQPMSPVKAMLLAVSVAWWWFANVMVADILLGLILFEVFHDVQYLTIVWLFNRRRVAQDRGVGRFTRFVFRRSWGLVALYVAMVFAYGGLGPLAEELVTSETAIAVATALITTSALLHFYFDGFIWKVREPATRESLGIDGDAAAPAAAPVAVTRHGVKWAFLLVPIAAVWVFERPIAADDLERTRALASSAPGSAAAQIELGAALRENGDSSGAVAAFESAVEILPDDDKIRDNLMIARIEAGRDAVRDGRASDASRFLEPIAAARPEVARAEIQAGYRAWQEKRLSDAIVHYRTGLAIDDRIPQGHLNLALAYRDAGRDSDALAAAERGAKMMPGDAKAQRLVAQLRQRVRGR